MTSPNTATATAWSATEVLLRQGLQFGVSIALARMLEPEAFGAIAIVFAFTAFAGVFVDAGFGAALVQKQDANHCDESTAFWFNVAAATVLFAVLASASPFIAKLINMPQLAPVLAVASSALLISAASSIHVTILTKALDFKTQAKIAVMTLVVSGSTAIAMAIMGFGVWALVGQVIASSLSTTVLYWMASVWRPGFIFSLRSFRTLSSFGGFMLLTCLVDTFAARIGSILIGLVYSPRDLGFYSRAETTALLPASLLQRIMPRVAFASYAQIAHDIDALRGQVVVAQRFVSLITWPAMIGLAAVAEPLVVTLFGDKWLPAVPFLQVLALAGLGMPYQVVNLSALMALGRSRFFFVLHLVKKVIAVGLIGAAAHAGPLAIAWAVFAAAMMGMVLDIVVPGKVVGLSALTQARIVAPTIFAAGLMGLSVFGFVHASPWHAPATLVIAIAIGIAVYGAVGTIFRIWPLDILAGFKRAVGWSRLFSIAVFTKIR